MEKAQLSFIAYKLQSDFKITNDQLREIFLLPHSVTLESYVKAFQYIFLIQFFIQTLYYIKWVLEQMIFVVSAKVSLNH